MQPLKLTKVGIAGAVLLSWMAAWPSPSVAQQEQDKPNRTRAQGQSARDEQRQRRFRAMDTNRDGVITRTEWRGNARSFDRHDWNHDGVLSGDEVWAAGDARVDEPEWRERAEREEDALLRSFRQADDNDDGIISRSEWRSGAESFERVDSNHDGVITRREFLGEGWPAAIGPEEEVGTSGTTRVDSEAYTAGYDRGLADGRTAGQEDKQLRNQWDLEGQRELEQADAGYRDGLGSRAEYQAGYRAGFRTGYRQGFGRR